MESSRHILVVLCCAFMISCGGSHSGDVTSSRPFPLVQIPSMVESDLRLDYMTEHFWDAFLLKSNLMPGDSTHINGVALEEVEQVFANYTILLGQVSLEAAQKSVRRLAARVKDCHGADASSRVLEGMNYIVEHYLYDPNSPMRDEDEYTPYAQEMAGFEALGEAEREYYAAQAAATSMNVRGTKAADFSFSDRNGRVRTLYSVKADFTLLFFSNPGCEACMDIINALQSAPELDELQRSGRLAVVNVYVDEDIQEWRAYLSHYPASWYSGYDHNHIIRDNELYNLRAIPSLYLLDGNKNVILKDATPQRLFAEMETIFEL